jgi:hypothetical protein
MENLNKHCVAVFFVTLCETTYFYNINTFRMKIKLLFILLLFVTVAHSQTRQPFKNIGKDVKVVTLTNGKYDEFFDEDTLQRIGSSVININTKKITKIKLSQEEIDELENAQASRFLSVDPLTSSYPQGGRIKIFWF